MTARNRMMTSAAIGRRGFLQGSGGLVNPFSLFGAPKGPPIVQDLLGALDDDGRVIVWRHQMWIPTTSYTHLIAAALIGKPDVAGQTGLGHPAISYA